ncbi:hypothetical protein [Domibacillus robiginosus]|uniref:hypothetical protein n=1 Tax=Domibacillus robiginosus TaxID=1071054 RepID=UPI00067C172C|nr:hypothetical protein [Domibacillus robiginosus]
MSLNHLKEMLQMLCYFNSVEITHTFSKHGQAFLTASCKKNTETIQLTFLENQTIEYYADIEEAATVIERIISE